RDCASLSLHDALPISLLKLVARRNLEDSDRSGIEDTLRTRLDWEYLFEESNRHGLLPLLYHHLTPWKQASKIPPNFMARMETALDRKSTRLNSSHLGI